ncbi:NAD(P)H-dependent oxidoreductase subunit E [bacterium]|nr:NAD(P)H-dependent oxidoreductase subunit E [bacterium]
MFQLSAKGLEFVNKELARYESKYSAIIPSLYKAQEENGWISPEVLEHLSKVMGIPIAHIEEVATFYTMFNKQPVGRHHVQVCTNITCSMKGAREILRHCCEKYNVAIGEKTADGRFTFSNAECLGSCDTACVAQIGDNYYEGINSDGDMDRLLEKFK